MLKIPTFSPTKASKITKQGDSGYDNARENIDPHIKTKVVSTKEVTLSDGTPEGFIKNDADGKLSGGHAGSVGEGFVEADTPFPLNGDGGNTFLKYNSVTGRLEIWVDGNLEKEFGPNGDPF